MSAIEKDYLCPLCKSVLTRDRFLEITGKWDDQQKAIAENEKKLKQFIKEKEALEKKHQQDLKKVSKAAVEEGVKQGIQKESKRADAMSKMIQKQMRESAAANKKIQELEKLLAEGKTPQVAGFDYEKEVFIQLQEQFPEDEIVPTGKKGDNIQYVKHGEEVIGSILYECKKTDKFNASFIAEVKRHMQDSKADFGVLVTHAVKDANKGISYEEKVIIVNPFGVLDMALILRDSIVLMHQLKKTGESKDKIAQDIIKYMQSGEFKVNMVTAIQKSEEAYNLMLKEIKSHKKDWEERFKIYSTIHTNVQNVRMEIGKIVTGKEIPIEEIKQLPGLPN